MRISAKTDYAVRAAAELATAEPGTWVKAETVSTAQDIPAAFLVSILSELRVHGLVESRRGAEGGYRLAADAHSIHVADVIRAVDGPLANIAGVHVEDVAYTGAAELLRDTWIALRVTMRGVLEHVSLADLVAGSLPPHVQALVAGPDAWTTRPRPGA